MLTGFSAACQHRSARCEPMSPSRMSASELRQPSTPKRSMVATEHDQAADDDVLAPRHHARAQRPAAARLGRRARSRQRARSPRARASGGGPRLGRTRSSPRSTMRQRGHGPRQADEPAARRERPRGRASRATAAIERRVRHGASRRPAPPRVGGSPRQRPLRHPHAADLHRVRRERALVRSVRARSSRRRCRDDHVVAGPGSRSAVAPAIGEPALLLAREDLGRRRR